MLPTASLLRGLGHTCPINITLSLDSAAGVVVLVALSGAPSILGADPAVEVVGLDG